MEISKIVIADYDPNIRKIAKISLMRLGPWAVEDAASCAEALRLIEEFEPDVLLLDVMMPGMDGPSVLRELQSKRNPLDIPVIFMTAKVMRHEVEEYQKMGAAGTVVKPFSPKDLADQIRMICATWRAPAAN